MPKKKGKILVAMSGGVDSSVAAALLVKQGYDVTGAFMKQISTSGVESWSDTHDLQGVCQWKQDRRDALRVAARLGIQLLTLNFEKEYKESVMEYMFREYKAGRTPNPDVLCNAQIKFGSWLERAREMGFEYLATGHYGRVDPLQPPPLRGRKGGGHGSFHLLQAKDKNKDQTYFLHQLKQAQLEHALFPVCDYLKSEVRSLARRFRLPTAEREESMGICFVGEVPMKGFLQQRIKPKPGKIVTSGGAVIGEHDGLPFYTIGQRHFGARMHKGEKAGGDTRPFYVIAKNPKTNELIVGHEDDPMFLKIEITVGDLHWVSGPAFAPSSRRRTPAGRQGNKKVRDGQEHLFSLECEVRLRHRQALQKVVIMPGRAKSEVSITFSESQRGVTPGQFAVFYKKGECLGGGVIL